MKVRTSEADRALCEKIAPDQDEDHRDNPPFLGIEVDIKPPPADGGPEVDTSVELRMRSLDVVLNMSWVTRIGTCSVLEICYFFKL